MAKYRDNLPQLSGDLFLTDGGFETTLVFHEGFDLPEFASFPLLKTESGRAKMREVLERYIPLATKNGLGFVLEPPTWRANPDWAAKIGYSPEELDEANRQAIIFMEELRDAHETQKSPMPISGCIGPQDDGYNPSSFMSVETAEKYHQVQINTLKDTATDFVTSFTICYVDEAIGIVRAAQNADMPVAIGFTVETDGRLPSGQPLKEAIEQVDAETNSVPIYYMINCAHPTHFIDVLTDGGEWLERIQAIRANSSCMSHEELDNAEELDEGNPQQMGQEYLALRTKLPNLNVLGGCCGTDHRHVEAIRNAWMQKPRQALAS
ncbi:MAG: homocysteine S-methyltransferase [Micavibrio sp.]|nr:MAG: homocysteine S-methyltransferase [Micavibrio sp.]